MRTSSGIAIGVVAQVCLLLATIVIHHFSELPPGLLLVLCALIVTAATLLIAMRISGFKHLPLCVMLWGVLAGATQAALVTYRAQERLNAIIPAGVEGDSFRLRGVVDSLPSQYERGISFEFVVEHCFEEQGQARAKAWCPKNKTVKLSWFNGAPAYLMPGQRWELTTKLRRPYARMNPFLFDAELRMFEQGITAQGSVRVREATPALLIEDLVAFHRLDKFLQGLPWWIDRSRHRLRDAIKAAVSSKEYFVLPSEELALSKMSAAVAGILVALVVGDQGAIASSWWTVFNQTGVGHLMSISGLHVTMMAGFVASIAMAIWKLSTWLLGAIFRTANYEILPSKQCIRWCAAIVGAWLYTALAGFGIPAQRTCWMVTLAGLSVLGGRAGSATLVVLFTATAITVIDPWAVMSAGFWLSFGAVSAIIYFGSAKVFTRKAPGGDPTISRLSRLKVWFSDALSSGWQSQVAATLSLLPVGAAFFSSFALLSPIANAISIPLISALVTPLAMAGAVLLFIVPNLGESVLWLGASITAPLLQWLQWLGGLPNSVTILGKPSWVALLLATLAMLLLLAPYRIVPMRVRFFGALAVFPVFLQHPQTPLQDQAWLTVFDVGQGSAILVETKNHQLLFDLGPSYGADADAGSAVISPYLRARGFKRLSAVVLSHDDVDHSSGLKSVLYSFDVSWVASSVPKAQAISAFGGERNGRIAQLSFYPCKRGDVWQWDGVKFEFMNPVMNPDLPRVSGEATPKKTAKNNSAIKTQQNARSCVLKVTANGATALLAADIEAADEAQLLRRYRSGELQADVLVAPNHGSKTSSSEAFLTAVDPKVAIFQLGFRNRLKYPDANVVERYRNQGSAIYRTDELGAIKVALPTIDLSFERNQAAPYWRTRLTPLSRIEVVADSADILED
jgi:competence protein ComEC